MSATTQPSDEIMNIIKLNSELMRDLQRVAIHEAGHLLVAERLGIGGAITIKEESKDGQRWYSGYCALHSTPDPRSMRLIGLAGAAAEAVLHSDPHTTGPALARAVASKLSASDRAMAGDFNASDLDEVIRMVWSMRPAVQARAAIEAAAVHLATPRSTPAAAAPIRTPVTEQAMPSLPRRVAAPAAPSLPRTGRTARTARKGALFPWLDRGDRQVSAEAARQLFGAAAVDDLHTVTLAFDDLQPRVWAGALADVTGTPLGTVLERINAVEAAMGIGLTPTVAAMDDQEALGIERWHQL